MSKKRILLPTHFKPYHYRLLIDPNLQEFTFKGELEIDIEHKEELGADYSKIKLHCNI